MPNCRAVKAGPTGSIGSTGPTGREKCEFVIWTKRTHTSILNQLTMPTYCNLIFCIKAHKFPKIVQSQLETLDSYAVERMLCPITPLLHNFIKHVSDLQMGSFSNTPTYGIWSIGFQIAKKSSKLVISKHWTQTWFEKCFVLSDTHNFIKAITGLDRESAHPLQLHAAKLSCCTAAKLGFTDQSDQISCSCTTASLHDMKLQWMGWFPTQSSKSLYAQSRNPGPSGLCIRSFHEMLKQIQKNMKRTNL